jgi:LuxR family maltose regulon positive regulatory protein
MKASGSRFVPYVEDGILFLDRADAHDRVRIKVGSDTWYAWLATAHSFIFHGRAGRFTARTRRRKGMDYWYAVRRLGGGLKEMYLGKGEDITLRRLDDVAASLGNVAAWWSHSAAMSPAGQRKLRGDVVEIRAASRLIETKLQAPHIRPSDLVQTQALERFAHVTGYPLTVVSAPVGYGKTTLLAAWIASSGLRVAWVSLDAGDNDPVRFWTYICAALNRLVPGLFAVMEPLLRAPNVRMPDVIANALADALSEIARPTILILDDYGVIRRDNALIHKAVALLVDRLPPKAHLVLITQGDPPLPLARLRTRQRLFELRTADLQFSLEETRRFLAETMRLDLSARDVETLNARSAGWIAGLRLAALAAPRSGDTSSWIAQFSGSNRHVFDYLIRDVLERQEPDIQEFLLTVAPLDQLTGPLCDAVTGSTDTQVKLEALERAGLFLIPMDDRREWYQFHPLFASALLQQAQKTRPASVMATYSRASEWCDANGLWLGAIDYALRARDFERAAEMLEAHIQQMFTSDFLMLLRNKLDHLPEELIRARPRLAMLQAFAFFISGNYPAFRAALLDASESFALRSRSPVSSISSMTPSEWRLLRGELLALYLDACRQFGARLQLGDVYGAPLTTQDKLDAEHIPLGVVMSRKALETLPSHHAFRDLVLGNLAAGYFLDGQLLDAERLLDDVLRVCEARGDVYYTIQVAQLVGLVRAQEGRLDEAVSLCLRAVASVERYEDQSIGSMIHAVLGAIAFARNDLDGAEHWLGGDLSLRHNLILMLLIGFPARAHLQLARGRATEAHATIASALSAHVRAEEERRRTSPWLARFLEAHDACLWLLEGNAEAAAGWVRKVEGYRVDIGLGWREPPVFIHEWENLVLARAYLAMNRPQDALSLLRTLREQTQEGERMLSLLESLALEAVAFEALSERQSSLYALQMALELGAPEGIVRPFIDGGSALQRLLKVLVEEPGQPDAKALDPSVWAYAVSLLAALTPQRRVDRQASLASQVDSPASRSTSVAIGPDLTPREIEVMRLIARGSSNQEIADDLVIALPTVKRHINNIYMKFGVHRRVQAVEFARENHLTDPGANTNPR